MIPRYEPMLAVSWPAPFTEPGWRFEPKWDGIRGIVTFDGSAMSIRTRRGTEVVGRYPELAGSFDGPIVLDGEIVTLVDGRPSFERLQRRMGLDEPGQVAAIAPDVPVEFLTFDVLHVDGTELIGAPVEERRQRLESIDLPSGYVLSEPVVADSTALWRAVVERDLEGMVAKRSGSPYRPGQRSHDWRKIHHVNTAKAVVGGYTPGDRGRASTFGALQLGLWHHGRLRWVGGVGTGFSDDDLRRIRATLDEIAQPESPFTDESELPAGTVFVTPTLVAVVGFRDWTSVGRLRHPRFRGFTDEPPESVTWEAERGPHSTP